MFLCSRCDRVRFVPHLVCLYHRYTPSHSARVLLLLDLTFIPLKRLSGRLDRLLLCIIIFLHILPFPVSLPSSYSSLTYLFSPYSLSLPLLMVFLKCSLCLVFYLCAQPLFYNAQGNTTFLVLSQGTLFKTHLVVFSHIFGEILHSFLYSSATLTELMTHYLITSYVLQL